MVAREGGKKENGEEEMREKEREGKRDGERWQPAVVTIRIRGKEEQIWCGEGEENTQNFSSKFSSKRKEREKKEFFF